MIDATIPAAVYHELLEPRGIQRAESIPSGLSGARVFECQSLDQTRFALKCWPEQTRRERIAEVHRIMTLARSSGCALIPALHAGPTGTIVAAEHRYWELADWMPGQALGVDAPLEKISEGAEAIAKFHASVRGAGTRRQGAPAAESRLERKRVLDRALPAIFDLDLRSIDSAELAEEIGQARQLLQAKWAEVSQRMTRSLTIFGGDDVETQYVLRDVHREHVLFAEAGVPFPSGDLGTSGALGASDLLGNLESRSVSGMIDFDAIRVDTPATDLARWTSSFLAGRDDEPSVWKATLAGYRRHCPFSEQWEKMAKVLAEATIWISLANWIVWILAEKRRFAADNHRVAARISELNQLARR